MLNNLLTKKKILDSKERIITLFRQFTSKSDYNRWGNKNNLSSDWDSRTEQIAFLIDSGSSVIEFGAGRLVLKNFLPENCSYTPSDIVDRGEGTIVCDLNGKVFPDIGTFDIAVFSGVLEYIHDLSRLLLFLSNHVHTIIASYAVTDKNDDDRLIMGWVNDYSSAQLLDAFDSAGFECVYSDEWRSQVIYKFRKRLT